VLNDLATYTRERENKEIKSKIYTRFIREFFYIMVRQHPQDDAKQTSESLQHRLTVKFSNAEVAQQLQKRSTESSAGMAMAGEHVMELEFEEWDGSTPFYQHCLAGSLAGVAEHCKFCTDR